MLSRVPCDAGSNLNTVLLRVGSTLAATETSLSPRPGESTDERPNQNTDPPKEPEATHTIDGHHSQ